MEFRKIKFTIYLVSVALLFLIVVQLLWAYASFKLSEERFNSNVMDAMRNAIVRVNEHVSCYTLFSKTQIKPAEGIYMLRVRREEGADGDLVADTVPLFSECTYKGMPFNFTGMTINAPVNMEAVLRFTILFDSTGSENTYLRSVAGITLENFRDKFSDKVPIYRKYSAYLLDSLLKKELASYSIRNEFHFAYVNSDKNTIEYQSAASDSTRFFRSSLKQKLSNDKYFGHPYDIVLYFDNDTAPIFSGIRFVLILSGLVIISLLVSFYIFIRIIYRQRKLSDLKNDFVNNMTHEFKTPLANISLVLETLSEKNSVDEQDNGRIMKILGQETERLRDNIEKILQVARFEKEKIHLTFERLDINQVIQNAVSCFEVSISAQNIEIVYDFRTTNPFIVADEAHIVNVVSNLVDNAMKYSRNPITITIATRNTESGIIFSIKDNGQGIAKDAQSRIFDKFYREPNGNIHTIKGFGLGLTYVKSIVDFHHGKITVKSRVGAGSEFEIYLPSQP